MDLYQLAKIILLLSRTPINRVRFARVIYFVHKELVRKKFMSPDDITYVRSPLGPIPEGLIELAKNHPAIIINPIQDSPSFAAEEYTLRPSATEEAEEALMLEQYREILKTTERVLKALAFYTTPELVRASHADPSWANNFNGARFTLAPADLKNTFPFTAIRIKIRIKPAPTELGALQADLLRGMMQDIVKESTDLEYPTEAPATPSKTANPTNPSEKPEHKPNEPPKGTK